jgi:hypothetical protein
VGDVWNLEQRLTASDATNGDSFGVSVALDGNSLVVGANNDGISSLVYRGAAYVFERTNNGWIQRQKLTSLDGSIGDNFGFQVAVSGETAFIRDNRGFVYVFDRVSGQFVERQKLNANTPGGLALSDNTAILGSQVFSRVNGIWRELQRLTSSDGTATFSAVALSGDTAFLTSTQGIAYAFARTGSGWQEQQRLIASDGSRLRSVGLSGDTAVIGSVTSAYAFTRTGGVWSERQRLIASDGTPSDGFASNVVLSGDTAVIGAPAGGIGSQRNGSVYVFRSVSSASSPLAPVLQPPSVVGSAVMLRWTASQGATSYRIRAGTSPGTANVFDATVGNSTALTATGVPLGSYFVRVHAVGLGGESAPSNEIRIDVGGSGPCLPPAAPTLLPANVLASLVTLDWTAAPAAMSYIIEAGSLPGATNVTSFDTRNPALTLTATAPPGTYYVRLRARNACGVSGPSNEVVVRVGVL